MLGLAMLPMIVFAADGAPEPLVPCGNAGQPLCTFNDFLVLADRIIKFSLFWLIIPLATISFAIAGFRYLIAFGNESEATKVHGMVTSTVKGVFLAFLAWFIVSTIFSFFVHDSFNPFIRS